MTAPILHLSMPVHDLGEARRFDEDALGCRVGRVREEWLSEPTLHHDAELSGKTGGKLVDPSGNVIEIKYYDDPSEYLGLLVGT